MSFAKVVISGTLTSDPEKRFTPNNHTVTNFTLTVENPGRSGNNEPFPVRVACWRNLAEVAASELHKGDAILVEGKLIMNSFQAQDGAQRKMFEIEAATIDKLPGQPQPLVAVGAESEGGRSAASYGDAAGSPTSTYSTRPSVPAPSPTGHFTSEDLLTEDDIPF